MNPATLNVLEELKQQADREKAQKIADLFDADPSRFDDFSNICGDLLFDYSKNNISLSTRKLLIKLANSAGVAEMRNAMFSGEAINSTEGRAVQHAALRAPAGKEIFVDGVDIMEGVNSVKAQMTSFCDGVRSGNIAGIGGSFTDVVNIGIGGSDLGPAMVCEALKPFADGPNVHFVSNVDGADLSEVLSKVPAGTTLFIVASKTFTTQETMTNAQSARDWLVSQLGEGAVVNHFAALSTSLDKTAAFGISDDRAFGFWDWVGGRYSVWSAIGLSVMLSVGPDKFGEFLKGAHAVDEHFQQADFEDNIPVLMALIGIWHRNVCGYDSHAVLPYDQYLMRFPAYLQQLDMESNGKGVTRDGSDANTATGPVVWGEPGTNGQHAFYQLIHQGTSVIPADFLIAAEAVSPIGDHHEKLVANAFAQTEALMLGKSLADACEEMRSAGESEERIAQLGHHKKFPGSRPTSTFLYPKLTPYVMGQLIALYEHKVFVQGIIWDVNSFDQWGVELGKQLAGQLLPIVKGEEPCEGRNSSTTGLVAAFQKMRS